MSRRAMMVPALILVGLALAGAGLALGSGRARRPLSSGPVAEPAAARMCGVRSAPGTYKHVIVIFMENHSYSAIYKSPSAPYVARLIGSCGLATNYHNVTHPSLPNYLAATNGGSLAKVTAPFESDCTPSSSCQSSANNIFNQLNTRHRRWKAYAEDMPAPCSKSDSGFYAPRHNPAVYYTDLSNCQRRDVTLGTTSSSPLLTDFSRERTAPAFSWVTPNLCHDMHGANGCPSDLIMTGDDWLRSWLPKITSTAVYKAGDTMILVSWDEGEPGSGGEDCATNTTDQSCHVVTIVVAPSVKPGKRVVKLFNHYSLLKTAEDILRLPELGLAKSAASMARPFNL